MTQSKKKITGFKICIQIADELLHGFVGLFKINRASIEARAATQWDVETSGFLLDAFPQHYQALGISESELRVLSRHARFVAEQFRITKGSQIRRLAVAMTALGAHMLDDPRFWANAHKALTEYYADEQLRLDRVAGVAKAWTGALWGNSTLTNFGTRLAHRLAEVDSMDFWSYADVLPQHAGLLSPEVERRFQIHVLEHLQATGIKDNAQKTAFHVLTLAHGIGWWTDPQYVNLRCVFETAQTPDAFVARIHDFYQSFP